MINERDANHLALWIAANHPALFVSLLRTLQAPRAAGLSGSGGRVNTFFRGLGDDTVLMEVQPSVSYVDTSSSAGIDPSSYLDVSPVGDTSSQDTSGLDVLPVTPTATYANGLLPVTPIDLSTVDTSSISAGPLPAVEVTSPDSSGTSSSSGLGSALAAMGTTLASAVAGVTHALLTPTGISTAGKVATSYFQTQAASSAAQTQSAILQAQAARVAAGLAPAAVSYQVNPATGQLVPTIATSTGYSPLTSGLLSAITPGGNYGTLLLLGGAVLLLLLL